MSWLFGYWNGAVGLREYESLSMRHDQPDHVIKQPHIYLAMGGNPNTIHHHRTANQKSAGWAVVGCGINSSHGRSIVIQTDEWDQQMSKGVKDLQTLDGHFAAVEWDRQHITLACDQLGQRTVYFAHQGDNLYFSTRLDWISKATRNFEVDVESVGSKWILFNQLSYRSGVKGILKLGPGGLARFSANGIEDIGLTPWLPEFFGGKIEEAVAAAEALVECACRQPMTVSLGLSGGMDSRLMMAMLMAKQKGNIQVHTFGNPDDPDVIIASDIARAAGISHVLLNDPLPELDECVEQARDYVAQTQLTEPVSSLGKLRYYKRLNSSGAMMIDGGFGEIARRQYLNRLAMLGNGALRQRNFPAILKLIRITRADIFVREISEMMEIAVLDELQQTILALPPVEEIGIGNFVDLLAVRTRVPNYGGPEQARLDSVILNFMPLVQPSFLRHVFAADVRTRTSARFYRNYIRSHAIDISRFPLVKSGVTYPFGLPTNAAYLLTTVKGRFGRRWSDNTPSRILHVMESYVRDLVDSTSVRNCVLYDRAKVKDSVEAFYRGESRQAGAVNWWLTFELWRQSLIP